ncbi:elongator complex protein 3 [Alkaliphilus peptidifermentans]|uniref:Radical SAM superfamily protein n=1 Tax=Alkaliphilus peptidifermentans DSM 18978 TaxID=1120976 RepID=A0A1G5J9G7_9FIRM|nr:radical SAM protein [Alkaliphilus peptidifermentans]SCY84834.1 Radical SAM superfamily protein [Alkaliphilus peptidifermentans DSM 18978]
MSKKKYIIPIFIPHRGCPHDCSFCNQKRIAGDITEITGVDVGALIEKYLEIYPEDMDKEVAFYGGSFTGIPLDKQTELLEPAWQAKKKGYIKDIRLSTRPDYINKSILQQLGAYGVSIIELGVQSTNDHVLMLNQRGHTKDDVDKAVLDIKAAGYQLGLQMMLGLAGDTHESINRTVEDFIQWKPDFVRVYPTIVIKDTLLEELYKSGDYIPFSLVECVAIAKEVLKKFQNAEIPVIRMGLQSTEEITYGKSVVAGPYHPAFREMVETEIYRDKIQAIIESKGQTDFQNLIIYCNQKDSSKVAGYKQSNKSYFIEKYHLKCFKVKSSTEGKKGHLVVEVF